MEEFENAVSKKATRAVRVVETDRADVWVTYQS